MAPCSGTAAGQGQLCLTFRASACSSLAFSVLLSDSSAALFAYGRIEKQLLLQMGLLPRLQHCRLWLLMPDRLPLRGMLPPQAQHCCLWWVLEGPVALHMTFRAPSNSRPRCPAVRCMASSTAGLASSTSMCSTAAPAGHTAENTEGSNNT